MRTDLGNRPCLRKGFYFSFDAVIALMLVSAAFGLVMTTDPPGSIDLDAKSKESLEADAAAESAMQVAIRQDARDALTPGQQIYFQNATELTGEDLEKPILDTIAVLWASNDTAEAQNLTAQYFDSIIPDRYNYRITIDDGAAATIYNTTTLPPDQELVTRATRLISGISRNRPTSGYIARAHLTETTTRNDRTVFFGGYVGDGNITLNVSLPDLHTVKNVTIEGDFAGPFDIQFNGADAGSYTPSTDNLTVDEYHICSTEANTSRCEALKSGDNLVDLRFNNDSRSSVSGGFLNIRYNRTTGIEERAGKHQIEQEKLPGIDGVINLYSAFHVPGELNRISTRLNYTADVGTIFLSIGNATVYEAEADGDTTVDLSNDSIHGNLTAAGLTYDDMSEQTIPYRVGVEHESLLQGEAGAIDAVSATSLAGSMSSGGKIDEAIAGTKEFINVIIDTPDARVGLTGFDDFIKHRHFLSQDNESLHDLADEYKAGGGTCVGCGIIKSTNTLVQEPIPQPVFRKRGTWRYSTNTTDDDWMDTGYDDTDWGEGTAPLGYGGMAHTQAGNESDVYRFRQTFDYPDDEFFHPYPYLHHAGNATVYLNGEQVHTSRMNYSGNYWDTMLGAWKNLTGLWYRSEERSLSEGHSWYFGLEETYRYATGHEEDGSLVTPRIDLSNVSNTTLSYSHWLEVQNKDDMYVEINDGSGWTELASYSGTTDGWENETIDVSSYATDTVQLRFRFDAKDAKKKNDEEEGWYVDNVKLGGFDSNVVDRSLLNAEDNVLAVEFRPDHQGYVNGSVNRSSFGAGTFSGTTETADGVELDSTTEGTFTSGPVDAGNLTAWTANTTGVTTPAGTNVTIRYATNHTGDWVYHDDITDVANGRYLKFKVEMRSNSTGRTPVLHWMQVNHSRYGASFDAKLMGDEVRTPSIVVMSDGTSNQVTRMDNVEDHDGDGSVGASDHAIEAACRANEKYDATVYAIAYDEDADQEELKMVADCGGGEFYYAEKGELEEIYSEVAQDIIRASFEGQRITVTGNMTHKLHPDSYISFNYTRPDVTTFGGFRLTQVTDRFGGNITSPKNGTFTVPGNGDISDVRVTSYSSNFWTDRLLIENASGQFEHVYRLWDYNTSYRELGDPASIHVPADMVQSGNNTVQIDTALSKDNPQGGSPDSRVIYTAEVEGSVGYGGVFSEYEGGNYTFDTIDGNVTVTVGNASHEWNASEDALGDAVERLIDRLDVTNDGTVDFQLEEDDLQIESQSTGGIEWLWGPATMSLEVWRRG